MTTASWRPVRWRPGPLSSIAALQEWQNKEGTTLSCKPRKCWRIMSKEGGERGASKIFEESFYIGMGDILYHR